MIKNWAIVISIVLLAVLMSGCMSAPVKETAAPQEISENKTKYVELNLMDGTKVGGKYVSESAAFTTIVPMYLIDKSGTMSRGNEKETAITTSLIVSMITIPDPSNAMNVTIAKQDAEEAKQDAERAAWEANLSRQNAKWKV